MFSPVGAILTDQPFENNAGFGGFHKNMAMAVALGDTFSSFAAIEKGLEESPT